MQAAPPRPRASFGRYPKLTKPLGATGTSTKESQTSSRNKGTHTQTNPTKRAEIMELKLLNQYPQSPMDDLQTSVMFSLLMMPPEEAKTAENKVSNDFLFRVLRQRLDAAGMGSTFEIDVKVQMFVSCIATSPGDVVLYAHTLRHLAAKLPHPHVYSFDDFTSDFHSGFPNQNERRKAWDAQKGFAMGLDCDNYLDTKEAWQV